MQSNTSARRLIGLVAGMWHLKRCLVGYLNRNSVSLALIWSLTQKVGMNLVVKLNIE